MRKGIVMPQENVLKRKKKTGKDKQNLKEEVKENIRKIIMDTKKY